MDKPYQTFLKPSVVFGGAGVYMPGTLAAAALFGRDMAAHKKLIDIFIRIEKNVLVDGVRALCHKHAGKAIVLSNGYITLFGKICYGYIR